MWYDALYCNDPSTDNIFGREDLVARRNAALLDHLRRGGLLLDFARTQRPDMSALTEVAKSRPD